MSKTRLWLQWVAANGLAEIVDMGVVGICAVAVMSRALTDPGILTIAAGGAAVAILGAVAGLVVGYAQWIVLRGYLPPIRAIDWVTASVVGGVAAWLLGMVPTVVMSLAASGTGPPPEISVVTMTAIVLVAGAAVGVVLGIPQWLVLRPHVKRAGWWICATGLAWMVATPVFLAIVAPFTGDTVILLALMAVLGASAVTGAIAGGVHGLFLAWLIASDADRPQAGE